MASYGVVIAFYFCLLLPLSSPTAVPLLSRLLVGHNVLHHAQKTLSDVGISMPRGVRILTRLRTTEDVFDILRGDGLPKSFSDIRPLVFPIGAYEYRVFSIFNCGAAVNTLQQRQNAEALQLPAECTVPRDERRQGKSTL